MAKYLKNADAKTKHDFVKDLYKFFNSYSEDD